MLKPKLQKRFQSMETSVVLVEKKKAYFFQFQKGLGKIINHLNSINP